MTIERAPLAVTSGRAGPTVPADGLPTPLRHVAVVAILLGSVLAVVDNSIGIIALPTIAHDLQVKAAASIWVLNAYSIAMICGLLPFAALGEIFGYRRVSLAGLLVFSVGAVLSASSWSLATLSMARVIQGLGAAGVLSVAGALMRFTYPHSMLGRAVSTNAMVIAFAAAAGPTFAAGVLSIGTWRWLFASEVLIAATALAFGWTGLPHSHGVARRFNTGSALLNGATFGLIIAGSQTYLSGNGGWIAAAEAVCGLLAGLALVRRELRQQAPLLPLDLLRDRLFSLSVATSMGCFAAQTLAFVSLPFDFQQRLGFSPVQSGLLMTPWPLVVICVAPFAGIFADRYRAGSMAALGLLVLSAGMALLALLPNPASAYDIAWRMGICGLGFALFQAPNNRAMLGGVPRARTGAASGMLSMGRSLGTTIGAVGAATCFHVWDRTGPVMALGCACLVAFGAAAVSAMRLIEMPKTEELAS